ncbi:MULTISPECIES: hypothetical protein [unclassified Gilliamella]|uniref:hypothetical protein n=1 Tax=unclassified Gilliamella TaxID=2685620 RepID=UPI00135D7EEA|nr:MULTISPECIES: hypothetical protein [unclassified Gilliamella]MWP61579.1 hypothetical protein [Gilliamella sp. Pas-s25]NUF49585.1 hypothetical protein [Gilliamella sp. ESL0250]
METIKKTITTIEQIKTQKGLVLQRTLTHIATSDGTLCNSYTIKRNEKNEVIGDSLKIAENQYPITCVECLVTWGEVCNFTISDFADSEQNNFTETQLKEICFDNCNSD